MTTLSSTLKFEDVVGACGIEDAVLKGLKQKVVRSHGAGSLFVGRTQQHLDLALTNPDITGILVSETPAFHYEMFQMPEHQVGEPIFSLVAEAKFLHRSWIGEAIAKRLYDMGMLDSEVSPSYRLVFHEGLMNAVEHGNLGLSSIRDKGNDSRVWFETYYQRVDALLREDDVGKKLVRVFITHHDGKLHTSILDVGAGFDVEMVYAAMDIDDPFGKGLSLSAALSDTLRHYDDGRHFYFQMSMTGRYEGYAAPNRNMAKESGRILIADDQKVNRDLCMHFLRSSGYRFLEIAVNGRDAVEKARSFQPDLILMDIMMPEMDGFEACKVLKSHKETQHIPVLFLSGLTDVANRTKGYQLGAVDYVNKPIDRNEMVARADVHILNGMMYRSMQRFSQRIINDLDNARRFQVGLLPGAEDVKTLESMYHVRIESDYRPTEELAGDYWRVFPIGPSTLGFMMVDFTGHGVLAALNTIRFHGFLREFEAFSHDPVAYAQVLNHQLYEMLDQTSFATFFYGVLHVKTGELSYVSCGAPPALVLPHDPEQDIHFLEAAGIPLGLMPGEQLPVELRQATLKPNDTIFLYSDALTETVHKTGEMWEDEGLLKVLEAVRGSVEKTGVVREVLRSFYRTASKSLNDDLSLLALQLRLPISAPENVFDGDQAGLYL